jgi:hypothetical protein
MSCERLKNIQEEIKTLIDNPNSTNEDFKKFYAKYDIPFKNKVETEIKANCGNIDAQIAENIIEVPQSCVDSTRRLCLAMDKEGPGSWRYEECMRNFGPNVKNNYQSNISNIKNNCVINTILGDPELAANRQLGVVVGMIMADRLINCKPNERNNFFDIFGSDQKIKIINECFQESIVEQKNYLKGCRVANKLQSNINDIVNECIIKAQVAPSSTTTPETVLTTPQVIEPSPIISETPIIQQSTTPQLITTLKPTLTPLSTMDNIITRQPIKITRPPNTTPIVNQGNNNDLLLFIVIGISVIIIIVIIILKIKKII